MNKNSYLRKVWNYTCLLQSGMGNQRDTAGLVCSLISSGMANVSDDSLLVLPLLPDFTAYTYTLSLLRLRILVNHRYLNVLTYILFGN